MESEADILKRHVKGGIVSSHISLKSSAENRKATREKDLIKKYKEKVLQKAREYDESRKHYFNEKAKLTEAAGEIAVVELEQDLLATAQDAVSAIPHFLKSPIPEGSLKRSRKLAEKRRILEEKYELQAEHLQREGENTLNPAERAKGIAELEYHRHRSTEKRLKAEAERKYNEQSIVARARVRNEMKTAEFFEKRHETQMRQMMRDDEAFAEESARLLNNTKDANNRALERVRALKKERAKAASAGQRSCQS